MTETSFVSGKKGVGVGEGWIRQLYTCGCQPDANGSHVTVLPYLFWQAVCYLRWQEHLLHPWGRNRWHPSPFIPSSGRWDIFPLNELSCVAQMLAVAATRARLGKRPFTSENSGVGVLKSAMKAVPRRQESVGRGEWKALVEPRSKAVFVYFSAISSSLMPQLLPKFAHKEFHINLFHTSVAELPIMLLVKIFTNLCIKKKKKIGKSKRIKLCP